MFSDEKKAFAYVATVMADGTPQVTPVWVEYDGKHVIFNTAKGRVKERNLRRNPQVALSVADPANPYRYIQVRGRAELTEGVPTPPLTGWPRSTWARTHILTANRVSSASLCASPRRRCRPGAEQSTGNSANLRRPG